MHVSISSWGIALILPVVICGCAADKNAKTIQSGDYAITVTTAPSPLEVGYDAEVTARVSKDKQTMADCRVRYRQFMPDHEMSADNTWYDMAGQGKGVYTARGGEFSMGGDWKLEMQINCADEALSVMLPYHLEWPE